MITKREVLGCYRFYGFKESDMLNDLGDKPEYDTEQACSALEFRVQKVTYGTVH